ncbi:MAG: MBOAT family protein [Eubacterium sp.]|nr:MBOAT family protein [Eubacterium sp.]
MLFNSFHFLIFLPVVAVIYYILPKKVRYIWLLAASYYFYMQWNPVYVLLLLGTTLVTYAGALAIEKTPAPRTKKVVLVTALTANLLMLAYFKYMNMLASLAVSLAKLFDTNDFSFSFNILLPVGISFFTLQALGYLIDVYRGDIYAEKNVFRYALFVSFFPQLVAGPIERSRGLLKQLAVPKSFSFENIRHGFITMLYGYLLKVVIADRIAIFVDAVYDSPEQYGGAFIIVATLLFTLQIYCDFYGYSTIAKGAARILGIKLMDNFDAPYLAGSIKEFWRRWHISLSTWFRDYLYIPLGGSRKGKTRTYINLMIVFAVSGLWHGASLSFVAWGILHGLYQVAEGLLGVGRSGEKKNIPGQVLAVTINFILVAAAWMLFRAGTLDKSVTLIQSVFAGTGESFNLTTFTGLGVSGEYFIVTAVATLILLIVDILKYKKIDVAESYLKMNVALRIVLTVLLLVAIILFGCYGSAYDTQQFIYFQF